MGKKDPRVDAYIYKAQDFAKPILEHLRELVHKSVPEAEETIKWGFPHFDYKGPLCHMAAFKQHCTFGFWKATIMKDPKLTLNAKLETAMGNFGRITSVKDLPNNKKMISYLKEAAKLNDKGIKIPKKPLATNLKEIIPPEYFLKVLRKNKKALETFNNFSNSKKKEYIEWIAVAKTEETKNKRIATAIEWMTDGKPRNWKYMKK